MIQAENFTIMEGYTMLLPAMTFIIGTVIYAIFIFNFYRLMARKEIFKLDLDRYNTTRFPFLRKIIRRIIHVFQYVFFLPIVVFFWFSVLTILLIFLSKSQPIENILRVSISIVSAVRITAYYTEDLSRDLAKMLPFALLGILLVDITFFSFSDSISVLLQLPSMWRMFVYYLVFVILLEFVLKIAYTVVGRYLPGNGE